MTHLCHPTTNFAVMHNQHSHGEHEATRPAALRRGGIV